MIVSKASGRAKCGICDILIAKDELEVEGNIGSGLYTKHYHVDCFKDKHWGFIIDLMHTMSEAELEDIQGALDEFFNEIISSGDSVCAEDCIGKINPKECEDCGGMS